MNYKILRLIRSGCRWAALAVFWLACCAAGAAPPAAGSEHSAAPEQFFAVKEVSGGKAVLSMPVGTLQETHHAMEVLPGEAVNAQLQRADAGDYLHLTWIIPDDSDQHLYDLELRAGDKVIHRRKGSTRGFGSRSFFFPLGRTTGETRSSESTSISLVNRASEPLYVESVNLLRGFEEWLSRPVQDDNFLLSLLVNDVTSAPMFSRLAELISAPGVQKGFCTEIYFAAKDNDALKPQLQQIRSRCEEHNLVFLPAVCSWWAGTPPVVRERIDFQQVCWSDTDFIDEGEGLKELLGERWHIHYGLTTPNMWSNTPWQTMNSPELNAMRHKRVAEAVALTDEVVGEHIAGYIAESEPAYWAFEGSDHQYPVKRRNLSADYNPHTVNDANKDGVTLDPSNGLDMIERGWLLRNVARYNEQTINAALRIKPKAPFYSHALLDYTHFPFADTGYARSYAEAAHVNNALLGIEMLWDTDMDALWRVREWGRWGCVNREECDRQPVGFHLATLRACYMMGGDHMNSYNWHAMTVEGDAISYMNQFLTDIRNGGRIVVAEQGGGVDWKPLTTWTGNVPVHESFPWFNTLELPVRAGPGADQDLEVVLMQKDQIVAYARVSAAGLQSTSTLTCDFGDLACTRQREPLELHLSAGKGWQILSSNNGPNFRLLCDIVKERRRSQYVISGGNAAVDAVELKLIPRH